LKHISLSPTVETLLTFANPIQVKGYINEMAVRVEDEDERISSLAKLFFHELSKKGTCINCTN
jgi:hypothetical protein